MPVKRAGQLLPASACLATSTTGQSRCLDLIGNGLRTYGDHSEGEHEFLGRQVLRQQPDLPFSDAGLRKWIANPLLMGRPRYTDIECEPLVDAAEWHQAQHIIAKRYKFGARAPRRIHLFTQSVVCFNCGKWMTTCWSGGVPKHRLKCLNTRCSYYGKGLVEWKVRDQLIKELRDALPMMLTMVEQVTQKKDGKPTPEQLALRNRLDSLLALKRMGTPEMERRSQRPELSLMR